MILQPFCNPSCPESQIGCKDIDLPKPRVFGKRAPRDETSELVILKITDATYCTHFKGTGHELVNCIGNRFKPFRILSVIPTTTESL